jgi:hypothetical protein
MRFNGCRCKACKTIAIGAASLFVVTNVYPTAYGDECWDQPTVRLYCQAFVPEQPHSPHSDQGSIHSVRISSVTVGSSAASSNSG